VPLDPNYDTQRQARRRVKKNQEQAQAQGSGQTPASGADTYTYTPSSSDSKNRSEFLRANRLAQEPTIKTDYGIVSAPDYYQNLRLLEQHSGSTLPTDVALYLSGLPQSQKQLIRTAQVFATRFDVPPQYVFGTSDPKKYKNPVTGEPLSLKDAQRFTNDFAPVAIASMIRGAMQQRKQDLTLGSRNYRGESHRTSSSGGSRAPIKAEDVASWAKTLSQYGGNLPLQDGVAMAVFLASQKGMSRSKFKNNVERVLEWYSSKRTTSSGVDDQMVLGIAVDATRNGKTFRSVNDVTDAVFGENTAINEKFSKFLRSDQGSQYQLMVRPLTINDLVDHGPDYWSEVQSISDRVALEQEAFNNSAFGKALKAIGWVGSKSWYATERGLVELGFGIETPVTAALGAATGHGSEPLHYMQQLRSDAITRLNQGEDVGDWVENGYSNVTQRYLGFRLPSFTSTAFDFAVGWYVDPTVVLGKAGRVLRGEEAIIGAGTLREGGAFGIAKEGFSLPTRILPGLEEPTVLKSLLFKVPTVGERLARDEAGIRNVLENGFENYVTNVLPKSRLADKLYDAVYAGNTKYFRELDLLTPGRNVTRSLDYEYMKLVRSKLLEKFPNPTPEARQAFSEALTAHFVGFGPEGSIAEWATHARIDRARGRVQDALAKGILPDEDATAKALSNYLAEGGQNVLHVPFTPEAPKAGGFYGPRSLIRRAETSQALTGSAIGKRIAQIPNVNPGRVLNMHEADDYIVLAARRWGTFDERAVRKFQSQVLEAQSRGYFEFFEHGKLMRYGYEDGVEHLIDEMNSQAVDYILRKFNIDDERKALLKDKLFSPIRAQNERMQTFWSVPAGDEANKLVTTPLWETQRTNFRYVIDPIEVRKEIRDYLGLDRRLATHFKNAIGKDAPEILKAIDPGHMRSFIRKSGDLIEGAWDARKRFWKALTVARPGYIPRVILTDENARFMFTTRSITERLAAQEWFGITKKLSDRGAGNLEFQLGKETKTIPLPGAFEGNALANGTLRQAEQAEEILKNAQKSFSKYKFTGGWGPVDPEDIGHLESWRWALQKQLRGSAPGQVALESIANGDDIATTRAKLVQWANDDHFVTLTKRIGVSPEEFDTWFDDAAHGAHAYTLSDKTLAQAALTLDGKDLEAVLDGVAKDARPIVHGPGMEAVFKGGGATWGNEFTNGLYKIFVSRPEEILNRQPYFKAMKRRAEQAYYAYLEHQFPKLDLTVDGIPTFRVPGREGIVKPVLDRPASELTPRQAVGDAEGYVYHISPPENIESIQENGLRPRPLGEGAVNARGMREPKLFFADSLDDAKRLAHGGGEKIAFRVKADAVGRVTPEELFPGSQYTFKSIPTSKIEVLTSGREWKPLSEAGRVLPSGIHHAVDVASTQFALQRVRSVMFDLTRQSRFTELLQIVFPFPQPFFEGFQTWGAIAMRHPEMLGRTMQLFRTGVDSGFIKKDPQTGEYVVPMGAFRWLAGASWAVMHGKWGDIGGEKGWGQDNRLDQLGIGFIAPLASFNLLSSSTIKFSGQTPIIGKLVGGVPLPAPGMDPLAALALQGLLKDSKSIPVTSYLFQYGPQSGASLLPTSVKAALAQFMPTIIPESQRQALTYSLLRSYQVNGMDKDENGNPLSIDELTAMAQKDANELLQVRALMQILSPAALRIQTPASPYEAEWQDLVENSPNYLDAVKEWTKRHPDLSYVTVGKTFYDAGIKGPDGEFIQAPRIPSSQFVDQLLKTPGIGDFMKNNRAWAGLVLIGIDPKIAEAEDFSTYSKLLSEGLMKYRPLDDYLSKGEDNKVSSVVDDWYRAVWDPVASNITDTSSPAYRDLIAKRSEFLAGLANQYPNWAATHLERKGEGDNAVYSWPDGLDKPAWYALAQARQIADTPGFENAPGFQALGKYLDIRDKIEARMKKDGLVDISLDPDLMASLGKQTAKLEQETPGIAPFISAYFGTSLNEDGTLRTADYTLQTLPQQYIKRIMDLPQDLRTEVVHTMSHYQNLRSNADRNYDYAWQENQNYQNAQSFFDQKYVNNPKVVRAWWDRYMTQKERAQYMADLATKPTVFYSAWDWHLQGVKLSSTSVKHLEQIAEWRIGISKYQTENPKADDIGKRYQSIDNQVAQWAKGNKNFARVIDNTNSWTFGLRAAGYGSQGDNKKVDAYWGYIFDLADKIQSNVDDANRANDRYHGTGGFDKDAVAGWRAQQDWLLQWVKYYQDDSPAFKRSWYDLQEQNGGDPIIGGILVPDTYYRLGGS